MKTILLFVMLLFSGNSYLFSQWNIRKNVTGQGNAGRAGAICFSVNGKLYIGGGYIGNGISYNDLNVYDPASDSWAGKNPLPGTNANRSSGITFNINGTIYMGLGQQDYATGNTILLNDLWQYDVINDTWIQKTDLPDTGRADAGILVISNKAYIVGGTVISGGLSQRTNDVWEYDPETNVWTAKTSLPVEAINNPCAFTIKNKGYIAGGMVYKGGAPIVSDKLYEYNVLTDKWNERTGLPQGGMVGGVAFALKNMGYCGLGAENTGYSQYSSHFYRYDPVTDKWSDFLTPLFPGLARAFGTANTIGNKAYAGCGWRYDSGTQTYFNDFYEFSDSSITSVRKIHNKKMAVYPNPATKQITVETGTATDTCFYIVYTVFGQKILSGIINSNKIISLDTLHCGQYILEISYLDEKIYTTVSITDH